MLPVGTAMRLRVKNALAMKKPKTEVSTVGAGESVYSPFGTLNIQNWGTYGEGDSNFCINQFVYAEYAPIDLNLDLGFQMWDNFTSGSPNGTFETYNAYSGYIPW